MGNLHDAWHAVSWKPQDSIKTFEECLRILVQCVSGDGTCCSTSADAKRRNRTRQVEVLKQMGGWLAKYGESVYGLGWSAPQRYLGWLDPERKYGVPAHSEVDGTS